MRLIFRFGVLGFLITSIGCAQYQAYQTPRPYPSEVDSLQLNKEQYPVKIISRPSPLYPAYAQSIRQNGWVLVQFDINRQGLPQNIEAIDSSPKNLFEVAAIEATSQWVFEYKKKSDELIKVNQLFVFELEDHYKKFELETISMEHLNKIQ